GVLAHAEAEGAACRFAAGEHRHSGHRGVVGSGEVSRAADQLRQEGRKGREDLARGGTSGDRGVGGKGRQGSVPVRRQAPLAATGVLLDRAGSAERPTSSGKRGERAARTLPEAAGVAIGASAAKVGRAACQSAGKPPWGRRSSSAPSSGYSRCQRSWSRCHSWC